MISSLLFALFALFACGSDPCTDFVSAWNDCAASGSIDADACAGETDDELSCAASALDNGDCSTEDGRAAAVSNALSCGIGVSGGSDTGYGYDTGY